MPSQPSHIANAIRAAESVLEDHGIRHINAAYWNLSAARLVEQAIERREGHLSSGGSLVVRTGQFTGRSPEDKFIVKDEITDSTVQWGSVNQPMSEAQFDRLYARMQTFWHGRDVFVQDCLVGADPEYALPLRVISQYAWHSLFALQLFIRPGVSDPEDHRPQFTIFFAPDLQADPATDGTNSETCIVIDFKKKVVLICGTQYAGEMKKSAFTIMNYLLPERGVFPMHCSANRGEAGDVALVLRTLGHGKTTLSADPLRRLIGDDEHGWSDRGRFQFRRRLLRQVHTPLAGPGAADLERHPLRHGSRKRGDGRRHARCSISIPRRSPRIPARPIRWNTSRTP
jgi:phosphoenolpyruvate carboxykinase (ATP)